MLIKDSKSNFDILDQFQLLENFNMNSIELIPVYNIKENKIISINEILKFSNMNQTNLLDTILEVCMYNNINMNNLILSIQEESMYLDSNLYKIVNECLNLGFNVNIEESLETKAFSEALDPNHTHDPLYQLRYSHGGYRDDQDSVKLSIKNLSQELTDVMGKIRTFDYKNSSDEDKENINTLKYMAANNYKHEGDIAAINRHLLAGKSKVGYTGDFIGTSGTGMMWNKEKIETTKKMLDDVYDEVGGIQGKMGKVSSNAMMNLIKRDINNTEQNMRDIASHIEREEIPRNVIARLIAKLRSFYHKIMFRAKLGLYNKNAMFNIANDVQKIEKENNGSIGGAKSIAKTYWSLGKNGLVWAIKSLAGKVLWLIDKLLQKLQNTANKAGDKINEWIKGKHSAKDVINSNSSIPV